MKHKILRLLFKFLTEYRGNPLFISGNALRHAIKRQIDTSIGSFTNTKNLYYPNSYEDFFKLRLE